MDNNQLMEQKWQRFWEDQNFFKADPSSAKKPYSLLMPPPNLTGDPHLGYAMQHSILDCLTRFKRMQGYDVLLLPGVDHAGIQFEATFTKRLEKEGLSKQKLGREEWLKKAWQFRDEVYASFHKNWKIFGISADWDREVFTLDPQVREAVLTEFRTFWEDDLLYKGAYIVQWCPKDQTAIEDVEMEYEERQEKFYYIRYPLVDNPGEFITIATVRPETMFSDVAVAVNPNDKRYKDLVGKKVIVPFVKREVPIIADELIDQKLGSGALKVDPAHSLVDYQIGQKNNLQIIPSIGKDGRLNENAGEFAGEKAQEVRKIIIEALEKQGSLEKTEDITHSVPVCERCKTTIEPLISEEWFVKMQPLAQKSLPKMKQINFIPKNYHKILSSWIEGVHDWCISRPLWWGYQIPVWYCSKCNSDQRADKKADIVISYDKPTQECQNGGKTEWIQEEKILDTWFSSGMWPLATIGWPNKDAKLWRYFPWDFELTSPEIRYMWITRMIMLSVYFTGEIPFKNMFFHGTLRDLQGRKISKSLGNDVDLKGNLERWGTDAIRMVLYSYAAPGRDGRISPQLMDQRGKNYRNFSTKLKNLYRFIMELAPKNPAKEMSDHPDDQNIRAELAKVTESVTKNINAFSLHLASDELYNFIWHELADKYVELSKTRREEAQPTLEYVFKTCLELLHPFMPFITEELWQKIPHEGDSIMVTQWPKS